MGLEVYGKNPDEMEAHLYILRSLHPKQIQNQSETNRMGIVEAQSRKG